MVQNFSEFHCYFGGNKELFNANHSFDTLKKSLTFWMTVAYTN